MKKTIDQFLKKIISILRKPHYSILCVILVIGIFFRFYDTPTRYSVGIDSSRDAHVAIVGAQELQLPLTGPFSSAGQFTFGPMYYHQLILFTLFTPFSYAPWIFMGVLSVLFIFVVYKIGAELFDTTYGLIAAFLAAISPPLIATAIGLINPNIVSFYAGLSILIFIYCIRRTYNPWRALALGVSLGLGVNAHYQMLGMLIIFPLLGIFAKEKRFQSVLWASLGLSITFIPLLLFDMNNHWFTLKHLTDYYIYGKDRIYIPDRWITYLIDFWPSLLGDTIGLSKIQARILILFSFLSFVWLMYARKVSREFFVIAIIFLVNFISIRYFWGQKFFGYLQFFYPFIIIYSVPTIWILVSKRYTYIGLILLGIITYFNFPKSTYHLQAYWYEVEMRAIAQDLIKDNKNQNIALYNCKQENWHRTQAVSLLLNIEKKYDENGKKVGFYNDGSCRIKGYTFSKEIRGTYDLSDISEEKLEESGWRQASPRNIYFSTVKWWYKEKP